MNDNELDLWLRVHNDQLNARIGANIDLDGRHQRVLAAAELRQHGDETADVHLPAPRNDRAESPRQVRRQPIIRRGSSRPTTPPFMHTGSSTGRHQRNRTTVSRGLLIAVIVSCLLTTVTAGGALLTGHSMDPLEGNWATSTPAAPGPLVIGVAIDQPGWGELQGATRSGFDIELANWLANELHRSPQFVDVRPNEREKMLRDGQVQLVIDSYAITDERASQISFVGPYMLTRQGIMVRKGDTRINTTADLREKAVCTTAGSTSSSSAQPHNMGLTIRTEDSMQQCIDALLAGTVDAVSTDQVKLNGYVKADLTSRLLVVPDLVFGEQTYYGIGFGHDNSVRCMELRDAIRQFITSGKWDELFEKYMSNVAPATHKPDPNSLDPC